MQGYHYCQFTKAVFRILFVHIVSSDRFHMSLLCTGGFEIALVWMCRQFDLETNCVRYNQCMLPIESFKGSEDVERTLVHSVFEFGRSIAELKLNDKEYGLLSAIVLLQAGQSKVTWPQ